MLNIFFFILVYEKTADGWTPDFKMKGIKEANSEINQNDFALLAVQSK